MKAEHKVDSYSILSKGLRYKLLLAFSLMSIIPLLIIAYVISDYFVIVDEKALFIISMLFVACILIALLGLVLAKGIIKRVIDVTAEAKIISTGNFDRRIFDDTADEIGQISKSINLLTKRIRNNMTELKEFQEKTKDINIETQKKVSVLSNLLQIGDLISSSVDLPHILEIIMGKLAQLYDGGFAAIYFPDSGKSGFLLRATYGLEGRTFLTQDIREGQGLLGITALKRKYVVLDGSSKFSSYDQEVKTKYKGINMIAFPIADAKEAKALLVVGNDIRNFTFTNEDLDIIKIFAQQISMAIENDALLKKAETMNIKDDLTGLFNWKYIEDRLTDEVRRASVLQKACSFVVLNIDDFKKFEDKYGEKKAEDVLKGIANVLLEFSMPLGKAGRVDKDEFALILPETNKRNAIALAEIVRNRIESLPLSPDVNKRVTVCCGVSENPLDGGAAEEIFNKAKEALKKAKERGKNTVLSLGE